MSRMVSRYSGKVLHVVRYEHENGKCFAVYYNDNGDECKILSRNVVPLSNCGKQNRKRRPGDFLLETDIPGGLRSGQREDGETNDETDRNPYNDFWEGVIGLLGLAWDGITGLFRSKGTRTKNTKTEKKKRHGK